MRWQGVIFWPPCPIYYNTSKRTWPLLMKMIALLNELEILGAEIDGESQVDIHQHLKKANEMARCYILASMSNILQHQHENMATTYDR